MDNIICPQVNSDDSSQVTLRWSQIKDVCVTYKNNYIYMYIENSKAISYTCQLFLSCRHDIFILGVPGFLTTQMHLKIPKTSENFQRRAKSSGDTCSGSGNSPDISQAQSWKCITKRDLASSAFYLKKYHHLHKIFISHISLSLHIFGNCVKQSCNHSLTQAREFGP